MVFRMMTISMGIFWSIFGYQIYKKQKFFLINRYVDKKMSDEGALVNGKLMMVYGLISLPLGVSMFFMPDLIVGILFCVIHLGMIAITLICQRRYRMDP